MGYSNSKGQPFPITISYVFHKELNQKTGKLNPSILTKEEWTDILNGNYECFYKKFPVAKNKKKQALPFELQIKIVDERLKDSAFYFDWSTSEDGYAFWDEQFNNSDFILEKQLSLLKNKKQKVEINISQYDISILEFRMESVGLSSLSEYIELLINESLTHPI